MSEKTYRIGEAAAKLNLKTYVLRFWEMEFPQIAPIRTEKGQRLYREADVAVLRRIRYLLHERGLTIEGARRLLREEAARGVTYTDTEMALPENFPEHFNEEVYDAADSGEDENEDLSGAGTGMSESGPAGPVQGSLFTAPRIPAECAGQELFSPEDVRCVIQELTAIRALLDTDATGDMP